MVSRARRRDVRVVGRVVRVVAQAPDYPLQLMLGLYRFSRDRSEHEFVVDYVRGYRRRVRDAVKP